MGGFVSLRAAAIAVSFAVATVAIPGFADTQHLRPGDRLTYDITLQVQQHIAGKGTSKNDRAVDSSAGAGTEALSILTVDPDGTANGTLSVDMLGVAHGQPVVLHKWMTVKVTPSGEIRPAASIDPLLDQAITLANRSVRDLASRDLLNSRSWRSQMQADTYPMTIALDHELRGVKDYQGFPTLIVQTTGTGQYTGNDPAQASVSLAGTYYYDQRDRLFIGQAIRSDTLVSDGSGVSVDSSTMVTIVLREFLRGPEIQVSPLPTPAPTSTPETPPSAPTAVPTQLGPSPLPTVTPSLQ